MSFISGLHGFYYPLFKFFFSCFHPLAFIQLETGFYFFYLFFSVEVFAGFENDLGNLKSFYLSFFVGYFWLIV